MAPSSMTFTGNLTDDGARPRLGHRAAPAGIGDTGTGRNTSFRHRRTRKETTAAAPQGVATVLYTYDQDDHLLAETDSSGPIRSYLWRDDTPVAQIDHRPTRKVLYLETDHLNTPRAARNEAGTLVWRWEADAFGSSLPDEDPDGDGQPTTVNLRFAGQYYDAETGLHYNGLRYYDPKIGRYLTSDPIGLLGGLNTYAYVDSNPLGAVDPLGLAKCTYSISSHTLSCTPNAGGAASALGPSGVFSGLGPCKNKPSCANDKNLGPVQPGDYKINRDDRPGNVRHWRLEPVPKVSGWKCYFGGARCGFKLHPGTLSLGCITADPNDSDAMKQYDQLHNLLQSEDGSNTLRKH